MNWCLIDSQEQIVIDPNGTIKIISIVHIQAKTVDDIPTPQSNWKTGSSCFVENSHKWYILGIDGEWI